MCNDSCDYDGAKRTRPMNVGAVKKYSVKNKSSKNGFNDESYHKYQVAPADHTVILTNLFNIIF